MLEAHVAFQPLCTGCDPLIELATIRIEDLDARTLFPARVSARLREPQRGGQQ